MNAGTSEYLFSKRDGGRCTLSFFAVCQAASGASAHPFGDWYDELWSGASPNVHWKFTQEVNGAAKRDSIGIGANNWDNAGTAHFVFTNDTPDHADIGFDSRTCAQGFDNTVHWEPISGGALAKARLCTSGNNVVDFMIGFDSGENWNTGSDAPGPNEQDLRAVATHEFGHATGGWVTPGTKGHWDEGGEGQLCHDDSGKHTMCSTITTEEMWQRTLETHDQHTFANAYS